MNNFLGKYLVDMLLRIMKWATPDSDVWGTTPMKTGMFIANALLSLESSYWLWHAMPLVVYPEIFHEF